MLASDTILAYLNTHWAFIAVLFLSFLALAWQRWYSKRAEQGQMGKNVRFRTQLSQLLLGLLILLLLLATLPINENLRAQLFSLFGLLISAMIALSSTTLVGNLMAGLMLRNNEKALAVQAQLSANKSEQTEASRQQFKAQLKRLAIHKARLENVLAKLKQQQEQHT